MLKTRASGYCFESYIVAPVAEEIVFRGCIGKALLAQKCAFGTIVWVGPALFSMAHVRDIALLALSLQKRAVSDALQCFVPICIKQIFGMISMFLFLRTGSVLATIITHSFCNYMGVPAFAFTQFRGVKDRIVGTCYGIGIVLFFSLLWPLTDGFDPAS